MEVNFLNQKPCIPSWPCAFQFDILFCVVLSNSTCISILGPCSSPSSALVMLFIHSAFSLCFFGSHILAQNRSVSFASGSWYVSFHSLHIVDRIPFRCFGISYFVCTVLHFVDISLIFLLWPVFFWFISSSCTVIFPHVACFLLPTAYFSASLHYSGLFSFFFYLRFQSNFPSRFLLFLLAFWGDPNILTN